MKKLILLSLVLAACAGAPPAQPGPATCAHEVVLPSVRIEVAERESRAFLKPGRAQAQITWRAGPVKGGDHLTPSTSPDVIGLGCLEGVEFSEL